VTTISPGRPLRRDSYHHAKFELDRIIGELAARQQGRLPSEAELADRLEVSRATVRSALLSLQKEGKIQRLHGRGTFINRHAFAVAANLGLDRPFLTLLEELGHEVAVHHRGSRTEALEPEVLDALDLAEPGNACLIERLFTASGRPAVLTIDVIPSGYLLGGAESVDGAASIFDFVGRNTGRQVRYSVADIIPVVATRQTAEALQVRPGTPLVLLRHVHIDQDDRPIAFTRAFINDEILRFSVVRTYTDS
jgi:GntR family transcriptional regulator